MTKATKHKMRINITEGTMATGARLINRGASIKITYRAFETMPNSDIREDDFNRKFPIVEASKLSLKDKFLKYRPRTSSQRWLKKTLIASIIFRQLKDFRKPAMDPSFKDGNIVYEAGLMPGVDKSCKWWEENAKRFMPERNSRLGTDTEFAAFLGVLIKYLINEMGYTVRHAWEAVCTNRELGHYWNSENLNHSYEVTGSRRIGLHYDLANTCKILSCDSDLIFFGAGDFCDMFGFNIPLAYLRVEKNPEKPYYNAVGWLVMDV